MHFSSILKLNSKTSGEIAALEEIFSTLKHISGGNLSVFTYSAVLGKLIGRKSLTQNKYSEKGYRDQTLNLDGGLISLES